MKRFTRRQFRSSNDSKTADGPARRKSRRRDAARRTSGSILPGPRRSSLGAYLERLESRTLLSAAPVTADILKDLNTAPAGANPTAVVAAGNDVFFTAAAPGYQEQLWFSDGTGSGTTLLESYSDPNDSNGSGVVHNMTAMDVM